MDDRAADMLAGALDARETAQQPVERTATGLPYFSMVVLGTFIVLGLFAEWTAPYSPYKIALTERLMPPFWQDGGTLAHLFGTDRLGRDILSRVIFGARVSLSAGVAAVFVGGIVGTLLGMIAGYAGRWVDVAIMRTTSELSISRT